jgi:membrane protein implicated in regulation of membrane protease activity
MVLSNTTWKAIILFFVMISAIIGGVSGVLFTEGLWQTIFISFVIGFGAYLIFLSITLLVLYTALNRVEELNRDK